MEEDTGFSEVTRNRLIAVVIGVVCLWLGWGGYLVYRGVFGFNRGLEAHGQFGDSFGALNALFSALAFLAVLVALLVQQRELKVQQKQLKAQLEEARTANEAFNEQVNALQQQSFDAMFFQCLDMLEHQRSNVAFALDPQLTRVRTAFTKLQQNIVSTVENAAGETFPTDLDEYLQLGGENAYDAWKINCRSYELILDYTMNLADQGKETYGNDYPGLLFGTMGEEELFVLYNRALVFNKRDNPQLLKLLKKYHPLEGLSLFSRPEINEAVHWYAPEVFGEDIFKEIERDGV